MTSFLEALKKGTDAHNRALAARVQVDEVLAKASAEIAEFDRDAGLTLHVEVVDRPKWLGHPEPREKVTMIVAKTGRGARASLSEIEFSEMGFPVTLRWERHVERANDRESFEQVLQALLESSSTGEKIALLLR